MLENVCREREEKECFLKCLEGSVISNILHPQCHVFLLLFLWKWKCQSLSHVQLFATCRLCPTRLLCLWNCPDRNTGVGCHFLLQGMFPTQGSNRGLFHCRQILYNLSHQRDPFISETPPQNRNTCQDACALEQQSLIQHCTLVLCTSGCFRSRSE